MSTDHRRRAAAAAIGVGPRRSEATGQLLWRGVFGGGRRWRRRIGFGAGDVLFPNRAGKVEFESRDAGETETALGRLHRWLYG